MASSKAPSLHEIKKVLEKVTFLQGECELLIQCIEPAAVKLDELEMQNQKSKETKTTKEDFKAFLADIHVTVNKCRNKGMAHPFLHFMTDKGIQRIL